ESGRRGYVYKREGQPPLALVDDEVLHIMSPVSLNNGVTGTGVLQWAADTIAIADSQTSQAGKVWGEGEPRSAPGRTDKGPAFTKDQKQELLASWAQRANKVVILEGLDWKSIGMTGRDMQFIEGRQFSVADICRFFRVPPFMVGDSAG